MYNIGAYIEVTDRTGTHVCYIEKICNSIIMAVAVDGAYHPCRENDEGVRLSSKLEYRKEMIAYINAVINVHEKHVAGLKNLSLLIQSAPDISELQRQVWALDWRV